VVIFLDKEKAVELIKELSSVCSIDLEKASLVFMPKNTEGLESKDVQLHILTAKLNFESRLCLMALLDERKWKYAEEPDKIVVFEPTTGQLVS
jgi:hypothetical protein